ncbi:uncharacterized protein BXZ73DRAFT_107016 [Epithele typhae]|uniref:uncharacterized protein n=1 Tax=Epithele typhae TaxID=378194 RepID=UPI0020073478|nr:uncharacterized protein BXZ73DRAFT_107016 [Epithele typhae]KAH9913141.1 hypothetical protein BXZ73DRAFT_107016 [Epithele typhae]
MSGRYPTHIGEGRRDVFEPGLSLSFHLCCNATPPSHKAISSLPVKLSSPHTAPVSLSYRFPDESSTRNSKMKSIFLLSLNDDVLLAVFSLLGREDALAMSSTCRKVYRLAIPLVFSDMYWSRDTDDDEEDGFEFLILVDEHYFKDIVQNCIEAIAACASSNMLEVRRVEALRPLPLRLAQAVPTLRVLALSSCRPGSTGSTRSRHGARVECRTSRRRSSRSSRGGRRGGQWGPTSEFVDPGVRRMRELRAEIARDERWWWIEAEGAARRPMEIWREDGERARALIERVDFEARSLDGFFSDKCRYER